MIYKDMYLVENKTKETYLPVSTEDGKMEVIIEYSAKDNVYLMNIYGKDGNFYDSYVVDNINHCNIKFKKDTVEVSFKEVKDED